MPLQEISIETLDIILSCKFSKYKIPDVPQTVYPNKLNILTSGFNKNTFYVQNTKNLKFLLKEYFNDENIIVFMGAGSITHLAHELVS